MFAPYLESVVTCVMGRVVSITCVGVPDKVARPLVLSLALSPFFFFIFFFLLALGKYSLDATQHSLSRSLGSLLLPVTTAVYFDHLTHDVSRMH